MLEASKSSSRDAGAGEGADTVDAWNPSHRELHRSRDEVLCFEGREPGRVREDLHLHVRQIGNRVDGKVAVCAQSKERPEKRHQDDDESVANAGVDE